MGRIWAIALHTVREAMRMKVVMAFASVIVLVIVILPFAVSRPDATVSATVQAFLSWSIKPLGTLLTFLAIFLGCLSISDEMAQRQIYTIVAKPIPRWQYIVGKWIGTVIVLAGLLIFGGVSTYCMASYLASRENPDSIDARKLRNEVLVARANSPLVVPDFTALARIELQQHKDEGRFPANLGKSREQEAVRKILQGRNQRWRSVAPGEVREFEFKGIKVGMLSPDDDMQLRYKAKGLGYAQDEVLQSRWVFGDIAKATRSQPQDRRDAMERYHTIPFKASAVAADGTLKVYVVNLDHIRRERKTGATMSFEAKEGFEVLYVIGTFWGNLSRTLFLVFCRLCLIAAVAVCAATLVSYPVACLMTFVFYVLSISGDFVKEALEFGKQGTGALGRAQFVIEPILDFFFWLWPEFKTYDAVEVFVDGRNVSLTWDILALGKLVLLLSTVFLIAGCLIFRRRQVAELSV